MHYATLNMVHTNVVLNQADQKCEVVTIGLSLNNTKCKILNTQININQMIITDTGIHVRYANTVLM